MPGLSTPRRRRRAAGRREDAAAEIETPIAEQPLETTLGAEELDGEAAAPVAATERTRPRSGRASRPSGRTRPTS